MEKVDVLVIGSGFGGATAAALLATEGRRVALVEAAAEWGGSAGKFQRKQFRFPVGATLGMGYERDGIHDKINRRLAIDIDKRPLHTVMNVSVADRIYPYYQNRDQFLRMWDAKLPHAAASIRSFFKEVWHIAGLLRRHMIHFPVLPPVTFPELGALIKGFHPAVIRCVPLLQKPLGAIIEKHGLQHESDFMHFLNGVLLDSMQTDAESCSALLGCTALDIYHRGAWYIEGGLYRQIEALVHSLKANGGIAKKGRRIVSIVRKESGIWEAEDHKGGHWQASDIVVNTTAEDTASFLTEADRKHLSIRLRQKAGSQFQWGAFTMYLALKDTLPEDTPLFHQFLLHPDQPAEAGNHFFVSISAPYDANRAPEGWRTVTVSTHIDTSSWKDKTSYDQQAAAIKNAVLTTLENKFPGFTKDAAHLFTAGPLAWQHYTRRSNGKVGGFPQTPENALHRAISHRSGVKGIWICGDNVFPGAGSIGASSSGVHCARSIIGRKLL
ncbi:phytoene desaturase family protein [Alkalicoccus luteus]|uniref:FAD-dependent oxidoreductase n=1 Tax=Alkalicoccus luteus TaxID=1237094 RepID=A0A969PNA5_9BACI|nr:NAD(P)-binding protein [Alkalicoccus luteus]NJP37331.1 FAD-dependent oxidoreductase [Alkalicoccus luteus]